MDGESPDLNRDFRRALSSAQGPLSDHSPEGVHNAENLRRWSFDCEEQVMPK